MGVQDRIDWDARYYERALGAYPPPHALLVAYAPPADPPPQRIALDLAAGLCQNAIWLAEQGYLVNAMDISRVALQRGRAEMAMRNLRSINFIQTDLDEVELPEQTYDLIACFRFLDRGLFPQLRAALRPGGMIIYETFNVRRLEYSPDSRAEFLLELGELPQHFPGWTVLHDEDARDRARFVALKPTSADEGDL